MRGQTLIFDFLLVVGLALNILILVLARFSKNNKSAKRFLMTIYTIYICFFIDAYINLHDIESLEIFGFVISTGLGFLIAPILFMYARSLVYDDKMSIRSFILHFLPFITIWSGFVVPFAISYIHKKWVFAYVKLIHTQWEWINLIEDSYIIVYALMAYQCIKKSDDLFKKNYSTLDGLDLSWLKKLLLGITLVISLEIVASTYNLFYPIGFIDQGYLIAVGVISLSLYLGYYGVTHSRVLIPQFLIESVIKETVTPDNKSPKGSRLSNLPNDNLEKMKAELIEVIETQKPYKDDALTLSTLADLMSISDKNLSELINNHMETNFYDLINSYRVEEVKRKINSDAHQNITLLGIAYESGFKSKSSFNRVFKQQVGMSPSAYKSESKHNTTAEIPRTII